MCIYVWVDHRLSEQGKRLTFIAHTYNPISKNLIYCSAFCLKEKYMVKYMSVPEFMIEDWVTQGYTNLDIVYIFAKRIEGWTSSQEKFNLGIWLHQN